VAVTTTLLPKLDAQVHDWASKGTSLGGRTCLSSWLFSLLWWKMSLLLSKQLSSVTTSPFYDTTIRPWQPSLSCLPYLPDMTMWSCSTSILHSCPSFPESQTDFLLLRIRSRNTWQCVQASVIQSLSGNAFISWLSPAVMGSLVTDRLLICCFDVILV